MPAAVDLVAYALAGVVGVVGFVGLVAGALVGTES